MDVAVLPSSLNLAGAAPRLGEVILLAVLLGGSVALAVGWVWWTRRLSRLLSGRIGATEDALGFVSSGSIILRAAQAIDRLLARVETGAQRDGQTHSITGLPTREPLFARMAEDGRGTLLLLACRDYDRLCAFDPSLGERLLLAIVGRLRAMLPPSRLVAQIDRAHLAVWLGPDVGAAAGAAEAKALVYALGDRLIEGEREILPEIGMRHASFDVAAATPQATLSRTLAAFAVPLAAEASPVATDLDLAARARERFLIEQDLRQAIARDELHMAFQPLIDAEQARVCGAEALLRWTHPVRGNVSPVQFIPVMEAAGLSHEIGLWALNHALREARGWQSAGLPGLRMAVNLSGHQLEAEALPLLIERTLARHGLAPDALEVELTESVALADGDRAARLCETLRQRGVHIAIDDFGTGYSSFSALRALAFEKLKIDRAFVTDIDRRRDSQAICGAILALGRGLGIRVLAEGVETHAEYAWLRAQGCRYFQGYYFARPLAPAGFVEFVRDPAALAQLLAVDAPLSFERLSA